MHDDVAVAVPLAPGEVVVVLDVGQHLGAQLAGEPRVDDLVVGGGEVAHQVHRLPVLLPRLGVELEPGEVGELLRQLGMQPAGDLRVVAGDQGARAARARVREHGQVGAGREPEVVGRRGRAAELHEVVARAARAELPGRPLAQVPDELRGCPAPGVQDVVVGALAQRRPVPNCVSRRSARSSTSGCSSSRALGRSSTVSFMRHAMSTPTPYGITVPSVASTPPIGRP